MKRRRKMPIETTPALVDTIEVRVRFSEVDSMRIVWHGEYVKYFEDGREAFGLRYPGLGYMDIARSGYMAPMVELQLNYLHPLQVNDVATVETRYEYTESAKICFSYIVRQKESGVVVATGRSMQVFLDDKGELYLNNPEFYSKWKAKWLKNRERSGSEPTAQ